MEDSDHYEMDDSDAEAIMPPANLMQTAREILARPVTLQELARAWDRSNHLPTEDRRVAACLDVLLTSYAGDEEPAPEDIPPAIPAVQAPARPATPTKSPQERRPAREVIDLSLDDDDTSPEKTHKDMTKRKRAHEDEDSSAADGFSKSAKILKTAGEAGQRKDQREEAQEVVPDWLLQQFREVAAAAPAPASTATPAAVPKSPPAVQHAQAPAQDQEQAGSTLPVNPLPASIEAPVAPKAKEPLAQVLAIIPDVDVEHATKLIGRYSNDLATCVEHVIDVLLADNSYPKAQVSSNADNKGKSKAAEEDDLLSKLKAYLDKDTRARTERIPTFTYREAALEYLYEEFSSIPLPFVRNTFADNNLYWAPTFIELTKMSTEPDPPYRPLKTARKSKGKGAALPQDDVLSAERETYFAKVARDQAQVDEKLALVLKEQEEIAQGAVFECGCCFDDVALSKMVQCVDAHLFCIDCAKKNAEHILGNRGSEITCMDQDGCTASFSDATLQTFLKTPQMLLLEKIRTEKAVEAAGLAGLSYCPHCSFGCVIDNPDEKLFYCLNEECKKITCRQCQKPDHVPKTCEEYASDLKTDTIHRVEEAMTEALLKRCPQCSMAILKEDGCNKMRCSKCNIMFCYVCIQKIASYEHFDQRSLPANTPIAPGGKCRLWDYEKMREYERVEAARASAIANIREERGDPDAVVSEEDLAKLGLEKPPEHMTVPGMPGYQYENGRIVPVARPGLPQEAQAPVVPPRVPQEPEAPLAYGLGPMPDALAEAWDARAAEIARFNERILQRANERAAVAAERAREHAARQLAVNYQRARQRGGYLPRPEQHPIGDVAAAGPIHQNPLPGPFQADPPVAAPAVEAPRARRRVKGGRA